ncbi:hypothetical protein ACJRO7_016667 [Eucalyptus globulus]|uniref:GH18 domain-containing protein n=1 Tax=Eucalyptus globulus TaxID=34317 RepID=A0ABD3L8L4_EUCGL
MKNFIATLHANNPPAKAHLSVGGIASNLSIFAALTVNFKNYWGAFPRSVIGVARDYNFDGIDSDWEFPTSPQNMSNLSPPLGGAANLPREGAPGGKSSS